MIETILNDTINAYEIPINNQSNIYYENPYLLFEARVSLDETTVCDEYAIKAACDDYCKQMLGRVKKLNGYLLLRMQSLIRGF